MNGAQHYTEAERLLYEYVSPDSVNGLIAQAQVHARLAHVAATVWANLPYTLKASGGAELWREVTS